MLDTFYCIYYTYIMAMITLKLQDDLRDKYKSFVALNRTTMQGDLLRYIEERVKPAGKARTDSAR